MWLLDTMTIELKEFVRDSSRPYYAILSHTWGSNEDEVTFSEMRKHRELAERKQGFSKIKNCCLKALQDGFEYVWIDTCCIDKRSSAELSEAINSMYDYYRFASICYAYLADVPSGQQGIRAITDPYELNEFFAKSRWFTRGWTLQELIAPEIVCFFDQNWQFIGAKGSLYGLDERLWHPDQFKGIIITKSFLSMLSSITEVPSDVLQDRDLVHTRPVAQRMSWASQRETTRGEDRAYSLMGLFRVTMPIIYGEGTQKAFQRLQLEIIREVPDQSIFAWRAPVLHSSGLLARSPADFRHSSTITNSHPVLSTLRPYSMTNVGLLINLRVWEGKNALGEDIVLASPRCWMENEEGTRKRVRIFLKPIRYVTQSGTDQIAMYRRVNTEFLEFSLYDLGPARDIYIVEDAQFEHIRLINNLDIFEDEPSESRADSLPRRQNARS